ncbi:histidine kinase [Pseudofrankia saprophytica]|uniref:histidine kinase n=1 Tax=Pseudofrankia saprophytica TaxID=298655 RepID=UPI000234BEDB|nr:histidine kinase [Pseudofrankia saprophytica]
MRAGAGVEMRSRRLRLAGTVLATAVLTVAVTTEASWPYWSARPLMAAVNVTVGTSISVAGVVALTSATTRRHGLLFTTAGLSLALSWLMAWNVGALPVLATFAWCLYWLTFLWGVLTYPTDRLPSRWDRIFVALLAADLFGGQIAITVTSRPSWNGFSPAAIWPALLADREAFERVYQVVAACDVTLITMFVVLTVRSFRAMRGLERRLAGPVLLSAGPAAMAAMAAMITRGYQATYVSLADTLDTLAVQGAASSVAPLALVSVTIHRHYTAASAADRLGELVRTPTVAAVRAGLRTVLRDDTLEIHYWDPRHERLDPVTGQLVAGRAASRRGAPDEAGWHQNSAARPSEPPSGSHQRPEPKRDEVRWLVDVRSPQDGIVATISVDPALRRHGVLVDAAISTIMLALENAQLQSALQTELTRLADARRRTADAAARERARIERELHDGLQQRLIALTMTTSVLEGMVTDPADADILREMRHRLRAATGWLRAIGQGLHPVELGRDGLRVALEQAAGSMALPVVFRISDRRYRPGVELAMYLALTAVLDDLALRAPQDEPDLDRAGFDDLGLRPPGYVRIDVRVAGTELVGDIVWAAPAAMDRPASRERPNGFHEGELGVAADRIRALGGSVTRFARPRRGVGVQVRVPCA